LHWLELGTVQTGIGKGDPAWKFKCTTAARGMYIRIILNFKAAFPLTTEPFTALSEKQ